MSNTPEGFVKVRMHAPAFVRSETVWAKPVGGDCYEIHNNPVFAPINYLDVVRASSGGDGKLEVVGVVRRSGHRGYRITFSEMPTVSEIGRLARSVTQLGADIDISSPAMHLVVNIPPGCDRRPILEILEGEKVRHHICCHPVTADT